MKKLLSTLLATTMLFSSVFAASVSVDTNKVDGGTDADTTFKIEAASADLNVIVPMYVVYAVDANGDAAAPTGYAITNNSAYPVIVSDGIVKDLKTSTYALTDSTTPAADKFYATVNGVAAVDAADVVATDIEIAANGAKADLALTAALGDNSKLITSTEELFTITYTVAFK